MSRGTTPRVILLTLLCTLAGQDGAPAAESGHVEVRVTDHRPGIGDFRILRVRFESVSLHARGQSRDKGWVRVLRGGPAIDIVPLKEGRSAAVGAAAVAPGQYDAVRLRFGEIEGVLGRGERATVRPAGTTVRLEVTVEPGSARVLLIDLYVEDQSDHQPGLYVVKIRDVRIEASTRGADASPGVRGVLGPVALSW